MAGLIDSTLREGEQMPGVSFSPAMRLEIFRLLAATGIREVEFGIASPARPELPAAIRSALRERQGDFPRLSLWSRCREEDILWAARAGAEGISLSIPVSDLHLERKFAVGRDWARKTMTRALKLALRLDFAFVAVGFEDASRADAEFLDEMALLAASLGAARLRLADTVGVASPATMAAMVGRLATATNTDIGVHTHNDFGMATANALAALDAGAAWADVTVLGLGERAGNARLEELVGFFAMERKEERYHPGMLARLCAYVADCAGMEVDGRHPVVGRDLFTCETGLHLCGLLREPSTYEPFAPERTGLKRRLLFGDKTGGRAVELCLSRRGMTLAAPDGAGELARDVRREARRRGRALAEEDVLTLAAAQKLP